MCMARKSISFLIFLLLLISACAKTGTEIKAPENENKNLEEPNKSVEPDAIVDAKQIPGEIKELLGIANEKVASLSYKYKGPESKDFIYEFYVKGDKIKYILQPGYKTADVDNDAYNTVYIDKKAKTAKGYCDARNCIVKGKKADLNYDNSYILTPLDWLKNIDYAEKTGEELIEARNTLKVSTSDNKTIWIDTFFGLPLRVESSGNTYKFQGIAINGVKDDDVTPNDYN